MSDLARQVCKDLTYTPAHAVMVFRVNAGALPWQHHRTMFKDEGKTLPLSGNIAYRLQNQCNSWGKTPPARRRKWHSMNMTTLRIRHHKRLNTTARTMSMFHPACWFLTVVSARPPLQPETAAGTWAMTVSFNSFNKRLALYDKLRSISCLFLPWNRHSSGKPMRWNTLPNPIAPNNILLTSYNTYIVMQAAWHPYNWRSDKDIPNMMPCTVGRADTPSQIFQGSRTWTRHLCLIIVTRIYVIATADGS